MCSASTGDGASGVRVGNRQSRLIASRASAAAKRSRRTAVSRTLVHSYHHKAGTSMEVAPGSIESKKAWTRGDDSSGSTRAIAAEESRTTLFTLRVSLVVSFVALSVTIAIIPNRGGYRKTARAG